MNYYKMKDGSFVEGVFQKEYKKDETTGKNVWTGNWSDTYGFGEVETQYKTVEDFMKAVNAAQAENEAAMEKFYAEKTG